MEGGQPAFPLFLFGYRAWRCRNAIVPTTRGTWACQVGGQVGIGYEGCRSVASRRRERDGCALLIIVSLDYFACHHDPYFAYLFGSHLISDRTTSHHPSLSLSLSVSLTFAPGPGWCTKEMVGAGWGPFSSREGGRGCRVRPFAGCGWGHEKSPR